MGSYPITSPEIFVLTFSWLLLGVANALVEEEPGSHWDVLQTQCTSRRANQSCGVCEGPAQSTGAELPSTSDFI